MTTQTENQGAVGTEQQAENSSSPQALALLERQREMAMTTFDRTTNPFSNGTAFQLACRMAEKLAASTILPTEYQGNPANVLVAIDYAQRLGVSPIMLAQNMDVVKGRPGLRGSFMAGLINASPLWGDLDYEWRGTDTPGKDPSMDYGCRAICTRVSDGKECKGPWVDWRMVKGEGWDKNAKWYNLRESMFFYRATSLWSRVWASNITLGLHETTELQDAIEGDFTPISRSASRINALTEEGMPKDQQPIQNAPGEASRGNRRTYKAKANPEPEQAAPQQEVSRDEDPQAAREEAAEPATATTKFDLE